MRCAQSVSTTAVIMSCLAYLANTITQVENEFQVSVRGKQTTQQMFHTERSYHDSCTSLVMVEERD